MLKIYTDSAFLTETYRKYVFPLLFDLHFVKNDTSLRYYQLIDSAEHCDIIVYPVDYGVFYKYLESLKRLNTLSKQYHKPIWIYTAGDYGHTNYIENSFTFRFGGFYSKLNEETFVLASFISDPYEYFLEKDFLALSKENKPTIGFVGHAKLGVRKYLNEYLNHLKYTLKRNLKLIIADSQTFYPSSVKRANYLGRLQQSKKLKTDFILRTNYRAGVRTDIDRKRSSLEFYNNIYNNLYTFCSRGVGNFSVRFYETLAVGRIPVLLNTDCRLPLASVINWETHIVILDEKSGKSFDDQILEFHNSKTVQEIEEIQKSNRLLWENFLKRESFFIKIHDIFKSKKY